MRTITMSRRTPVAIKKAIAIERHMSTSVSASRHCAVSWSAVTPVLEVARPIATDTARRWACAQRRRGRGGNGMLASVSPWLFIALAPSQEVSVAARLLFFSSSKPSTLKQIHALQRRSIAKLAQSMSSPTAPPAGSPPCPLPCPHLDRVRWPNDHLIASKRSAKNLLDNPALHRGAEGGLDLRGGADGGVHHDLNVWRDDGGWVSKKRSK